MSINSRIIVFFFPLFLSACFGKQLGPEVSGGSVRFALHAPKAQSVSVAGSFNRWDPKKNALSGPDRKGMWAVTVQLPEGRYEYLFIIDGKKWLPDPGALSVDDGLGGRNSVVEVGR